MPTEVLQDVSAWLRCVLSLHGGYILIVASSLYFFFNSLDSTTEEVNCQLSWLLAGMPAVESFSFTHGETSMSKKEEKKHSYPPLPCIVSYGGGELMWPHSLKHLSLSSFYLEADTFTENTEFPSLSSLKLTRCGGNVDTIINNLRRTHPNVEVTKVESRW